jgi:alpha-L-fucosidase
LQICAGLRRSPHYLEPETLDVKLLGAGDCEFNQASGVLTVKLPTELPSEYTNVLAITLG